MRFCMECGEKLSDDQLFCPNCGTKVTSEDTVLKEQTDSERDQYTHGRDQYVHPDQLSSDDALQFEEGPEAPAPKKKNKLWIGFGIGAGILAVGAIVLILILTGAFGSKSMKPSKEKLVMLEEAFMSDTLEKAEAFMSAVKDASFDADVTFDVSESSYSSSGFSNVGLLNSLSVHLCKDARKGHDIGILVQYFFNPVLDLRLFDLDKDNVFLYCSPGSNDLYQINKQQFITQMLFSEYGEGANISQFAQLLLSDQAGKLLEEDFKEVQKLLLDMLRSADIDIEEKEKIELFDGEEETCELYTVRPTSSEIEAFLAKLFDYLEKGNGFLPRILKLYGISDENFERSRGGIPEAAKELHDMHLTLEIAVQDNTIIHQKVSVDSLYFGYDAIEKKSASHMRAYFHMNNQSGGYGMSLSGMSFELDRVRNSKGMVDLEMNIADMIQVKGSYDLNKKSEIGTYAGNLTVSASARTIASVTIEPSKNGMLHKIELNPDLLNMHGVERIVANVDVKPASGVEKPSGAEIVDTSAYSGEDWRTLLNTLLAPITYAFR
ncbi:MAG: zinc-ribbon domain-containing protein [Clostridia bacterium]|nr:zinc-ribbon domain-containing protein [Clostridia bacterium]